MKVVRLVMQRSRALMLLAATAGVFSGAATIVIIAVLERALAAAEGLGAGLMAAFVAAALVVLVSTAGSSLLLVRLAQRSVHTLRLDLCRRILRSSLRRIEDVGAPRLLSALTDDVMVVTNAVQALPLVLVNSAIVVGALVYIGVLSPVALGVMAGVMVTGVLLYQLPMRRAGAHLRKARSHQDELHHYLNAVTQGTKELKLNRRLRHRTMDEGLHPAGQRLMGETVRGVTLHTVAGSWGQLLFLATVGVMIFTGPALGVGQRDLVGFTLAVLYLNTPLVTLLNVVPNLNRANVALEKIQSLELGDEPETSEALPSPAGVRGRRLELEAVCYEYTSVDGDERFELGPVDLDLQPGTTTFLVGGNGSGKTTLAKIVAGLYQPTSGAVRLDGRPVSWPDRELRDSVSAVFADAHVFPFVVGHDGMEAVDDEANELIRRLRMSDKVEVREGVLSTVELSTGQRKRLALMAALLVDRPVLLFDEWAADQDPGFRDFFYLRLLPALREEGRTVVAITHDDRYFDTADQAFKLERGRPADTGGELRGSPLSDQGFA